MDAFPIIGIYSPASQSGKTTAARYLQQALGLSLLSFATPVKTLAMHFLYKFYLQEGGHAELYQWASDFFQNKEKPIPDIPGTPTMRNVLEAIGDDFRKSLHDDIWLEIAKRDLERVKTKSNGAGAVFDDVRYPNEAEWIKTLGGFLVKVILPGRQPVPGAKAEGMLDHLDFDAVVINSGKKGDFFQLVTGAVASLLNPNSLPQAHRSE